MISEGRFGGPQARISAVAKRLRSRDIETTVVLPKYDSEVFYDRLLHNGVRCKRLRLHRLTREPFHLFLFFFFFVPELILLYRFLVNEKFHIVHCNGAWEVKASLAGKLAGLKVIWHLNDTSMPLVIRKTFRVLAARLCSGIITAGEKVKSYYLNDSLCAQKEVVEIQAPVDTIEFAPGRSHVNGLINKLEGLKIITIANINRVKGIEYFLEMTSILNSKYEDLNFVVIGSILKSQRPYLKKLTRHVRASNIENVRFMGPSADIGSMLKVSDIYVCSSVAEASPISVWEAMAMGKAIVTSDVGDVSRFINDGENGFVVPIRDASSLAEKVGLLIENEELRVSFGKRAREVAVRYLDIEKCVNKHEQFYRKILYDS